MLQNFPLGPLGPSRFERGAAVSTMIPAAPRLDAFVSGRTQFMAAAVTLIGPATLSSDRSLFQGVLMAAFRIGNAQEAHDCAPFGAVRSGLAVTGRGDQMGNLVGDGLCKKIFVVMLRNVQVVAQHRSGTSAPLHLSGRLSVQIEPYDRVRKPRAV